MFCPPTFSGVDNFCTNADVIHRMIGAMFVKFRQLVLLKIIIIDAIRCQILTLNCTKFNFSRGSSPDTAGRVYSVSPDLLCEFNGPTSKGK